MSSSGPVMDWDWLTPSLTFQSYSRVQTPLLTLVLRATPRKIIPSTLHEKQGSPYSALPKANGFLFSHC